MDFGNRATTSTTCASMATTIGVPCISGTETMMICYSDSDVASIPTIAGYADALPVRAFQPSGSAQVATSWTNLMSVMPALEQFGMPAWGRVATGCNGDGTYFSAENCADWTDSSGASNYRAGRGTAGTSWLSFETIICTTERPVYCACATDEAPTQEPTAAPSIVPGSPIVIYDSAAGLVDGSFGLVGADAQCSAEAFVLGLSCPTRARALVSTSTQNIADFYTLTDRPVENPAGTQIANSYPEIFTRPLFITFFAAGVGTTWIWTGSDWEGQFQTGAACSDWSSTSGDGAWFTWTALYWMEAQRSCSFTSEYVCVCY